jgi:dethiobiotin synthetase
MRGIFITGTDTNVGKTWFSVRLIRALRQYGLRIIPRKPVESGWLPTQIEQTDAYQLADAAAMLTELQHVCPYHFQAALSPPRAAQLEKQQLSIQQLKKVCLANINKNDNDFLIVEGAGGFYSPLADDGLNADLAKALQLPIMLVVDDKLGCINHTLLSLAAIQQYGLKTVCVFLNQRLIENNSHSVDANMDNANDLRELTDVPICTDMSHCTSQILAQINPSLVANKPDLLNQTP